MTLRKVVHWQCWKLLSRSMYGIVPRFQFQTLAYTALELKITRKPMVLMSLRLMQWRHSLFLNIISQTFMDLSPIAKALRQSPCFQWLLAVKGMIDVEINLLFVKWPRCGNIIIPAKQSQCVLVYHPTKLDLS